MRSTPSGVAKLSRLFSSPLCRCSTCLDNVQTIELMLVGVAWALAQWGEWDHRCYYSGETDRHYCAQCNEPLRKSITGEGSFTLTSLTVVAGEMDAEVSEWVLWNQGGPIRGFNWSGAWTDEALNFEFTNSIGTSGVALTVENLLAAQQALLGHEPE